MTAPHRTRLLLALMPALLTTACDSKLLVAAIENGRDLQAQLEPRPTVSKTLVDRRVEPAQVQPAEAPTMTTQLPQQPRQPVNATTWMAPPAPSMPAAHEVPTPPPAPVSTVRVEPLAGGQYGTDDGPADRARFIYPAGLAMDPSGSLIIAEAGSSTIRRLSPDGLVTTVGVNPGPNQIQPYGVAVGPDGLIYLANGGGDALYTLTPCGERAELPGTHGQLRNPTGVAIAPDGTVYIADRGNHRICAVKDGVLRVVAGGKMGYGDGYGPDARFFHPTAIAVRRGGTLVVADTMNARIREVTPDGRVRTIAGYTVGYQDGPGLKARFQEPVGIAVDAEDAVVVTDAGAVPRIRLVKPDGQVETLAGGGSNPDAAGPAVGFANPMGLAVGSSGEIYVAEPNAQQVRQILRKPGLRPFGRFGLPD